MIYLDYSATTPVSLDVLDTINKTTKDYIANPNSLNNLGTEASKLIIKSREQIGELLFCEPKDIYFTSGATESNNLALIGVAQANHRRGKHIITSKIEHPSVRNICNYLKNKGFEISYVKNDKEGLIDFDDLKSLIREDTILVSICAVNSEMGVRQPLKMIRQIIKKENSGTYFHSDITQALGKTPINLSDLDMASASAHKIYGPKGIGLFYKSKYVRIDPLLIGGVTNELIPGTPPVPLIVGFSKAIRLSLEDMDRRTSFIDNLNQKIVNHLKQKPNVLINKTNYSIPHILNFSIINVEAETFIRAMDEKKIYLGTNTACSSGDTSEAILAVYNDLLRARHTIRLSLSHLTTLSDINFFLQAFDEVYESLSTLKKVS